MLLNDATLPGSISWTEEVPIGLTKKFTVTIKKVGIPNSTANLSFTSTVDALLHRTFRRSLLWAKRRMSILKMVDANGNPISNPSYHAASKQEIRFKFTARNTTIGKGGYIKVFCHRFGDVPPQVMRLHKWRWILR